MPIEVRVVTDPIELQAVYRQRYEIWVEEYGCQVPQADVKKRTFIDALDETAVIIGAFDKGRLVGSVRVNYGDVTEISDGGFGEYVGLYDMQRFGHYFPERLSVITKMVIDPAYRSGTLMARLALGLYEHARDIKPQVMFCLIDCMLTTKDYFMRLGYHPISPEYLNPVYKVIAVPGAFIMYDHENFKRVNSPLARACPYHDEVSANWFRETFILTVEENCTQSAFNRSQAGGEQVARLTA